VKNIFLDVGGENNPKAGAGALTMSEEVSAIHNDRP
jgi:hypothetical protein